MLELKNLRQKNSVQQHREFPNSPNARPCKRITFVKALNAIASRRVKTLNACLFIRDLESDTGDRVAVFLFLLWDLVSFDTQLASVVRSSVLF